MTKKYENLKLSNSSLTVFSKAETYASKGEFNEAVNTISNSELKVKVDALNNKELEIKSELASFIRVSI